MEHFKVCMVITSIELHPVTHVDGFDLIARSQGCQKDKTANKFYFLLSAFHEVWDVFH